MKAILNHSLVCDVIKYDLEQGIFYKLVVYNEGSLYRISIPKESVKNWKSGIGQYTDIECNMTVFDGKSKFKIA